MLLAYRLLTFLLAPILALVFLFRGQGVARIAERFGFVQAEGKHPLWFHCASVGEFRAALPLIKHNWGRPVFVTVQSQQGYEVAQEALGDDLGLSFAPFDSPLWFGRFLRKIGPAALVLIENELWPGWMRALNESSTPVILLDANLSPKSKARWRMFPGLLSPVSQAATCVTVSAASEVQALQALGFTKVIQTKPLKLLGERLPVDDALFEEWQAWGQDGLPFRVFANLHPSDLRVLHGRIFEDKKTAQVIIAPRHPDKLASFEAVLGAADDRLAYWTSFGTLGTLYALADSVVLGGGFDLQPGSHNPLEPLRFGMPVEVGPNLGKQEALVNFLVASGLMENGGQAGLEKLAHETQDEFQALINSVL